jgi:hypothetical protein
VDAALENTAQSVFFPSMLIEYMGSEWPIIGSTSEDSASEDSTSEDSTSEDSTSEDSASAGILREVGSVVVDPDDQLHGEHALVCR